MILNGMKFRSMTSGSTPLDSPQVDDEDKDTYPAGMFHEGFWFSPPR
jgi:hypothetical protein